MESSIFENKLCGATFESKSYGAICIATEVSDLWINATDLQYILWSIPFTSVGSVCDNLEAAIFENSLRGAT